MIDSSTSSHSGAHAAVDDPRNDTVRIYVNGDVVPKAEAVVSVYDSGFMLGDGVWEGIRLHNGTLVFVEEHLDRLFAGAKAIDLDIGMDRDQLIAAMRQTIDANDMHDGVHLRLMVTRGRKSAPFQDPRLSVYGPTIVIIPEYKEPSPDNSRLGLRMFTVHVPRGTPVVQDPRLNSHSKLNCITALIQAQKAGYDEALMLDPHGFVNTGNSVNFFAVVRGQVWTSTGDYCMPGITRAKIMELCMDNGIPLLQKNFSLHDVYSAEEAFVTGTFAGPVPVVEIDGRTIGSARPGIMVRRLRELYADLVARCSRDG